MSAERTMVALSEGATQAMTTALFLVVVAITLGITVWASRRNCSGPLRRGGLILF